jgi:hypothetical protein
MSKRGIDRVHRKNPMTDRLRPNNAGISENLLH